MKIKLTQLIICASTAAVLQQAARADDAEFRTVRPDTVAEIRYDETKSGLCRDRRPRQGLGAEDLTGNERRFQRSGAFVEAVPVRHPVVVREKAGAAVETESDLDTSTSTTVFSSPTRREMVTDNFYCEVVPKVAVDRRPRQGLGAEDLTRGSYASSDFVIRDPSGANSPRFYYYNSDRNDEAIRLERERQMEIDREKADAERSKSRLEVEGSTEATPDSNP